MIKVDLNNLSHETCVVVVVHMGIVSLELLQWSDINRITAHKVGIVLSSDRYILEIHNNSSTGNTVCFTTHVLLSI